MDKPFSAENSPFLTPYSPPGPAVPGIKPFTAVDLAPPLAPGGPRLNAPPQASPFLDKDPVKPFSGLAAAAPAPAPAAAPVTAPALAQLFAANPAFSSPGGFPLASKPAPAAAPVPAPMAAAPEIAPPPVPAPAVPIPLAAASASPAATAPLPAGPAASRAPAAPRQASATGAYPKSALTMTDADASAEPAVLPMTTGPNFDGRRIRSYLGVVSAEIVIPKDVLFRNPAPYGDLHRLKAAEEHLQLVKRKAFEELGAKARALGADGMVGAALQFSQIDAMVFLCAAVGTAVKIE